MDLNITKPLNPFALGVHSNVEFKVIKEGSAEILIPSDCKVFYNPVQEFNRDLSVAVLQVAVEQFLQIENYKDPSKRKDFRILEALSATGLRSIRYAKEIANVKEIVANDISQNAIEIMERNIIHNDVANIVTISNLDAKEVMFKNSHTCNRFQAVDLDPYGCPSEFLDTAVQCVADGGLLLVTCTDMAVLCGNSPETCFIKYGSVSLKSQSPHEMALRIVLHCIQSHAARYKRYIIPLIAISVDFYIRVVIRIFTSPVKCKEVTSKLSMVFVCNGCGATHFQPLGLLKTRNHQEKSIPVYLLPSAPVVGKTCVHCSKGHSVGGPIWTAPLHDMNFLKELILVVEKSNLKTKNRLLGILNVILEELNDVPLYYNLPQLSSNLKAGTMPMMTFRSAVLNGGYRISYSHACRNSCKTDAPMTFIWDILKEWIKQNYMTKNKSIDSDIAKNILTQPVQNKIDFSLRADANPLSRKNKLLRFQANPAPNWGPGTRSTANISENDKRAKNQNKNKRKYDDSDSVDIKKIMSDSNT